MRDTNLSASMNAFENRKRTDALFSELYTELLRVARRESARGGAAHDLGATTLLHEAYLDMAGRNVPSFPNHARFIGYAARVMHGLVLDHARKRCASKRGGQMEMTTIDAEIPASHVSGSDVAAIGEALTTLAEVTPALADVVQLKYFAGFSFADIAAMQGISTRTIQRRWKRARVFLRSHVGTCPPKAMCRR